MSDTIEVGDRVTWLHRWHGQGEEQMVGTVIDLDYSAFGHYAWMSVENDQSPLFARVDRLTKPAAPAAAEQEVGMTSDIKVNDRVEWTHHDMPLCGVVQELRQYNGVDHAIVHAVVGGGLLNTAVDVRRLRKVARVTA